jgi:hypothetical protein
MQVPEVCRSTFNTSPVFKLKPLNEKAFVAAGTV